MNPKIRALSTLFCGLTLATSLGAAQLPSMTAMAEAAQAKRLPDPGRGTIARGQAAQASRLPKPTSSAIRAGEVSQARRLPKPSSSALKAGSAAKVKRLPRPSSSAVRAGNAAKVKRLPKPSGSTLRAGDAAQAKRARLGAKGAQTGAVRAAAGRTAAGLALYAATEIAVQEIQDPGKTRRDLESGNINIDAVEVGAVAASSAVGGPAGLAVYAGIKLTEQEINDPGKTARDINRLTGGRVNLTQEDTDTALMVTNPALYGVVQIGRQERRIRERRCETSVVA